MRVHALGPRRPARRRLSRPGQRPLEADRRPPRHPRDEGRTWALGQLASADAALALLEQRARHGAWPEFAEYDCYGCHHGLTGRPKPGNPRRTLAWGSWYFAVPKALADATPELDT